MAVAGIFASDGIHIWLSGLLVEQLGDGLGCGFGASCLSGFEYRYQGKGAW
jgi:hypothetical protein